MMPYGEKNDKVIIFRTNVIFVRRSINKASAGFFCRSFADIIGQVAVLKFCGSYPELLFE